ncbi:hypothetical protein [Thermomonospora umbrina]|uniref:Ribosomally synthesized peptide with SipW-like signal peptide n=1 Tax=Thermomonospora umbrina TaxID=111806 RepID=A0A3D9T3U3_9ACTN|nr:hypothetical protein [Thermomonospora umbrina]REF01044.1 hypothetical protein DFJ69_6642 [Thermomonospora umbrina]
MPAVEPGRALRRLVVAPLLTVAAAVALSLPTANVQGNAAAGCTKDPALGVCIVHVPWKVSITGGRWLNPVFTVDDFHDHGTVVLTLANGTSKTVHRYTFTNLEAEPGRLNITETTGRTNYDLALGSAGTAAIGQPGMITAVYGVINSIEIAHLITFYACVEARSLVGFNFVADTNGCNLDMDVYLMRTYNPSATANTFPVGIEGGSLKVTSQ